MHNQSVIREIRRYRNRRLYDTTAARTITQKELAELVQAGEAVRVIDYATGRDITVNVLAQVAHREVSGWPSRQEGTLLYRSIIAKGGDMGKKALNSVILAGLGALSLTREKAEEIIDALIKKGEVSAKDRKVAVDDLIAKAEDQAKRFAETMKAKASQLRGIRREEYDALKSELDDLRKMVSRLEEKLGRPS